MQIRCGQCGNKLRLDDVPAEETIACPRCGHELYVGHFPGAPSRGDSDVSVRFDNEPEEGYADELRRAMEQKIRFTCGKCGRGLKVEKRFSGKRIRCPACKTRIRVPYPDEEAEFEFAALPEDVGEVEIHVEVGDAIGLPDDAVEMMAAGGKMPRRKVRVPPAWALLVAAITITWMALLAYWLVSQMSQEQANTPTPRTITKKIARTPSKTQPTTAAGPSRTQPASKPAPVILARLIVTGTQMSCLIGPRRIAARRRYCCLRVDADVEAGSKPLRLRSFGGNVVFVSDGREYPSLGLAISTPQATAGFLRARKAELHIAAGRRDTFTFIFEVPMNTSGGAIRIKGVGGISPVAIFPLDIPDDDAIVGRYAELPPRNLQPMLRDPVMSAIQKARSQQMSISKSGRILRMGISSVGVAGTLMPAGNGHYDAILHSGAHELKCALRILSDGKTLILYLSDSPFHQIVYRKIVKRR